MKPTTLALSALLALGTSVLPAAGQGVLNPDPEIFDGSKTKIDPSKIPQNQQQQIDNWEDGPTMIVYDGDGPQGNGEGLGGGEGSGLGGLPIGIDAGLPIPLPGLPGIGLPGGQPALPAIPTMQQGGGSESKQNADTKGAAASASKPSDVAIGDPSQRIKTTAQGQAGNEPGAPEDGEEGSKKASEDSTQVPSSSNTSQTGVRGGGVEQGDVMDPNQI